MIDKDYLKKLEEKTLNDPVKQVLQRVLVKSKAQDIASVLEQSQHTQFNFSIDIKTPKITQQNQSGRCWIFSGLNFLRVHTMNKLNVEEIEFSQNYLAFFDKLEKINFFLESAKDFINVDIDDRTMQYLLASGIQDGGQWTMFANLVKKYGIAPKSVYPDTTSASNTYHMNQIINRKLSKYVYEIRSFKKNVDEQVEKLKEKTLEELYGLLATNYGVPPKKFDFEYIDKDKKYHLVKDLTPHEFYKLAVDLDLDQYQSIINSPTTDKPYLKTYTVKYLGNVVEGDKINHLNLPIERMKELMIKQLKDNEVVWFGCDVGFYGDRDKGVWDDKSFDYEKVFGVDLSLSKAETLDYRVSAMNHAMVVVGVNLVGEEEKPNKWKIENSWGAKSGNNGFYLCTDTWFDRFVYQALINKKYLNEEEKKALEEKPIELKPWDPMGTLA